MNRFEEIACSGLEIPQLCVEMLRNARKELLNPSTCRFAVYTLCLDRCRAGEQCVETGDEPMCEDVYDELCLKNCAEKYYRTACLGEVSWYMFLEILPTEKLVLGMGG